MSKIALFKMKSFQAILVAILAVGIGLAFALDSDNDGMSDLYETFFKLNATNSTDAAQNYDTDLLSNLQESSLWTDPMVRDTDADGFPDGADSNALSRAVMIWGAPDFTDGDLYRYTGPQWWLGAEKAGGSWSATNGWVVGTSNTLSELLISLDRSQLTNDLMMGLSFDDLPGSALYVRLFDDQSQVVASNLVGNLVSGSSGPVYRLVELPLAAYPEASTIGLIVLNNDGPIHLRNTVLYIDEDQDGLDADQEQQMGTSDSTPDSDDDGVSDGQEVLVLNSDPLVEDTDGDGLSDLEEMQQGTDPTLLDSDGDGLSDRFELFGCMYQVVVSDEDWHGAKTAAEVAGGHLAAITSAEEHTNMLSTVGETVFHQHHIWIGATDEGTEGVWRWVTGEPFAFEMWETDFLGNVEPNNKHNNEHWAAYGNMFWDSSYTELAWFDMWVGYPSAFLLERDAPLDPLNPDMDNDGLNDGLEVALGSNPRSADSDGDGLSDLDEYNSGITSPAKADTDSDGLDDKNEPSFGTDPANPDCDNDGLLDGMEVGSTAFAVIIEPEKISWDDARIAAEVRSGHLGTITSQAKHDQLVTLVGEDIFRKHNIWIGATDADDEGNWRWVTGEPVDFNMWAFNNPDNHKGKEHWAGYYNCFWNTNYTQLGWNDFWPKACTAYVVEFSGTLDPFNADIDNDGLLDGDELANGCSPFVADTDGDGINDAAEVAAGTDPGSLDTDRDGLLDTEEPALGTDMFNADSDDDGLKDGYEVLYSKYELNTRSLSWEAAQAEAQQRGGMLACITDTNEHAIIFKALDKTSFMHAYAWIGASHDPVAGAWSWVSGETWNYEQWDPKDHHAVSSAESGWGYYYYWTEQWRSSKDTTWFCGSIIEYPQFLDPLNPDCDNDGVKDGDEVEAGSSPFVTDSDGDGLSDLDEINAGLNPVSIDSDRDGAGDAVEWSGSTDMLNPDCDGDGLLDGEELATTQTDPLKADTNQNGIPDVSLHSSLNGADETDTFSASIWVTWTDEGTSLVHTRKVNQHSYVTYTVTVTEAGIYRLGLQTSWIDMGRPGETHEPPIDVYIDGYLVRQFTAMASPANLPEYSCYTPWLDAGTHELKLVLLPTAHSEDTSLKIDAVELYTIDGDDSNGNGIPDWMEAILDRGIDTDGDGLSDSDEINIHQSNVLNADTDGDGLIDGAEVEYGTDIHNADTDGDGVSDGAEVLESMTNPLGGGDFDGTFNNVVVLSGRQFTNATGYIVSGQTIARIHPMRGSLEYAMDVPQGDVYRLSVSVAHDWLKSQQPDPSRLEVYLDGLYIGTKIIDTGLGEFTDITCFLPWLTPGNHIVSLVWDNYDNTCALLVQEVRLQEMGGSDANGNGIKEWVEYYLDKVTGIDPMPESYVSPACIEGDAQYVPFMSISGGAPASVPEIKQSVGARWYADMPLTDNGDLTSATVSFQNGGLERSLDIMWVPYNLIDHDGATNRIRAGDALRLTCLDPAYAAADLEKATGGQFTLNVDGEVYISPNTRPIAVVFTNAGTYTVSGEYTQGGNSMTAAITVEVIGGGFPAENPACMPERPRNWSCTNLPPQAIVEHDVTIDVVETTPDPPVATEPRSFILTAHQTLGEHWMIARINENGPILDHIRVDTFWSGASLGGYAKVVEEYDDMDEWEFTLTFKNLPPGVTLVLETIVAGVVFADDFSTSRVITVADLNEQGAYVYRLTIPHGVDHSACHTIKMYQDGVYLGEAYSSGEFQPGR